MSNVFHGTYLPTRPSSYRIRSLQSRSFVLAAKRRESARHLFARLLVGFRFENDRAFLKSHTQTATLSKQIKRSATSTTNAYFNLQRISLLELSSQTHSCFNLSLALTTTTTPPTPPPRRACYATNRRRSAKNAPTVDRKRTHCRVAADCNDARAR